MNSRGPCKIVNFLASRVPNLFSKSNLVGIKRMPFLRPTSFTLFFCFNAPCQYTPLLNLCPLVFDLTPTDSLHSITLTPTYSVISYRNVTFDLRLFYLWPVYSGEQLGHKKGSGVVREIISDEAKFLSRRILLYNISILRLGPQTVQHRFFVLFLCNWWEGLTALSRNAPICLRDGYQCSLHTDTNHTHSLLLTRNVTRWDDYSVIFYK